MSVEDLADLGEQSIPQGMRDHIAKLEEQAKTAEAARQAAETKLKENEEKARANTIVKAFTDKGLTEAVAQSFMALHPQDEPTSDAITAHAESLGLKLESGEQQVQEPTQQTPQPQPITDTGATPAPVWHNPAVTGSTIVAPAKMTEAEWMNLMNTDALAGRAALAEGRVDLKSVVQQPSGAWGLPPSPGVE